MIEFHVDGQAVTQGSKTARVVKTRDGRSFAAMFEQNARNLTAWRARIAEEAQKVMDGPLMEGPLAMEVVFTLPRPKSRPKKYRYPDKKPDYDKLVRAVGDALTKVVYRDDSQLCHVVVDKRYEGDPEAGERPGVSIVVMVMEGAIVSPQEALL